ncbi:hypothetical protein GUF49_16105, partial [Xanthomonas citri pv. citri]|nr:hypothetical protein [Xanthomonas citri pv. citri]
YVLDEIAAFYFNKQFISQKLINEAKPPSETDATDLKKSLDAPPTGADEQNGSSAETNGSCDMTSNKLGTPGDNSSSYCNSG